MLAAITGASAGIGTTFARQLAARGWDLLLIARRTDRLEALARELAPRRVTILTADLTHPADLESAATAIAEAPDLGLLVNNAGFGTLGYFWEADIGALQQMQLLHVVAATRLTHAAVGNLVRQNRPGTGVINVSSVAAFTSAPQNVGYCASKAWMNTFTQALSVELGGRGSEVKVQALCPGYTYSEFHDVLGSDRAAIPAFLWKSSDFVVGASLRGFDQGKLIVIPGWPYKVAVGILRVLPNGLVGKLSAFLVRRYRKSHHPDNA